MANKDKPRVSGEGGLFPALVCPVDKLPLANSEGALARVSPCPSYFRAYPQLNERIQYEWALVDAHDSLTDYYKRPRNKGQVRKTLEDAGAVDIYCEFDGNGVEARCRKP